MDNTTSIDNMVTKLSPNDRRLTSIWYVTYATLVQEILLNNVSVIALQKIVDGLSLATGCEFSVYQKRVYNTRPSYVTVVSTLLQEDGKASTGVALNTHSNAKEYAGLRNESPSSFYIGPTVLYNREYSGIFVKVTESYYIFAGIPL